jgi:hypothetical protein
MATVPDLARAGDVIDPKLSTPNRLVVGTPIALALTPQFSGEIVQNTVDGTMWLAIASTAGTAWTPYGMID